MREWTTRSKVAAAAAILLAVVIMLLTVNWKSELLIATGLLTLALVGVAHPAALPAGGCPTCKARPRNQQRTVLSCTVDRALSTPTSWAVTATVERLCTNCRETRKLVEECHVSTALGSTPSEAVILVMNGTVPPSRILTNS